MFKECQILEFIGAYDEFNGYFARVFTGQVPYARSNKNFFNQLVERLSFREIANTCFCYSESGIRDRDIGGNLAKRIATTILVIYDIGIKNPVVFETMLFFEEGIGADHISDMSAYFLIRRLIAYTQRVCKELGIPMRSSVRLNGRPMELPTYHNVGYVFVPHEVLCDIPTARLDDDVDSETM